MSTKSNQERWQQFRDEILDRDFHACVKCGRSAKDGAILQVHHLKYILGRVPWEYLHSDCTTLCKGCHAVEHGIIAPRTGWKYVGHDDLGDLRGECDYCGNHIRHVFYVQHPDWQTLGVGTICCDLLTESGTASERIESMARMREKRERFVSSSRWKEYGAMWSITQQRIDVQIRWTGSAYVIHLNGVTGTKRFNGLADAKAHVFDVIDGGIAETFLQAENSSSEAAARRSARTAAGGYRPSYWNCREPTCIYQCAF